MPITQMNATTQRVWSRLANTAKGTVSLTLGCAGLKNKPRS